jgi:hypothetical protein
MLFFQVGEAIKIVEVIHGGKSESFLTIQEAYPFSMVNKRKPYITK